MDNNFPDSEQARMTPVVVGVLAIQGSFAEHAMVCKRLGFEPLMVKTVTDLERVTHLILPGGESTTQQKLMENFGLWAALKLRIKNHELRVFGTCAGAILLSRLGMDIAVERNGYGAQQASVLVELESERWPALSGVFIRAPKFTRVGEGVVEWAHFAGAPVLLQQGVLLAAAFHPELTDDTRVHEYFLNL